MSYTIKKRFIERDFLFNKIQKNSEFLNENEINQMFDEIEKEVEFVDYTFYFTPYRSSWKTKVKDNNNGEYFDIGDLTGAAYDYYVNTLISMVKEKLHCSKSA